MRPVIISLCCSLLAAVSFAADPAPRASQAKPDTSTPAARQVEIAFQLRDQIQKNESMWMDPKYTSPEIEKLRQRMEVLKKEMLDLQVALRDLVAELPEAKAETAKVEKLKAEHQALARQIEESKKRRE